MNRVATMTDDLKKGNQVGTPTRDPKLTHQLGCLVCARLLTLRSGCYRFQWHFFISHYQANGGDQCAVLTAALWQRGWHVWSGLATSGIVVLLQTPSP